MQQLHNSSIKEFVPRIQTKDLLRSAPKCKCSNPTCPLSCSLCKSQTEPTRTEVLCHQLVVVTRPRLRQNQRESEFCAEEGPASNTFAIHLCLVNGLLWHLESRFIHVPVENAQWVGLCLNLCLSCIGNIPGAQKTITELWGSITPYSIYTGMKGEGGGC